MPHTTVHAALRDALHAPDRLAALRATELVDSAPESGFDDLTGLAAELLEAPVSLVSLVTADRQFFKSCVGLPAPWGERRGTALTHSFCQYVVATRQELVVEDARADATLRENRAIPDLGVVAYAGVPILSLDGHVLGSFCVIDTVPRRWTERELRVLRVLAAAVSDQIAAREASRRLRTQLADVERSYREVVDALDEIVFSVDTAGRWTWLSPKWTEVTGYAVDASIGRAFLDFVYPDDRAGNAQVFDPLVAGETNDYRHLMRYVHADGSVRWLGARARSVRDARNVVIGAFGTLNDVTARVRAEQSLRAREDELARTRKLEAVGRLAAGIAHDFNNVLAVVGSHAQMLAGEVEAEEAREDVATILEATRRGAALTRQLLAVSSRQPAAPERVDVNEVVQAMSRMLGRVLGTGITVATRLADDLPPVHVDRSQLEQVLLNLLVNARDAMPRGGEVTVATATGRLPGGRPALRLTVRDTGTGMSAETLAHLFEPFYTTKEAGKGTGLGLATVHGIVTQWGGRVQVESEEGAGSEFRVLIPV